MMRLDGKAREAGRIAVITTAPQSLPPAMIWQRNAEPDMRLFHLGLRHNTWFPQAGNCWQE